MVHADSTKFDTGLSKQKVYEQVITSLELLIADQRNWVANCANASSLIWYALHSLPAPSNRCNWVGVYVVDHKDKGQLVLGPFHGKVACQTIRLGRGVCGSVAVSGQVSLVEDVHNHPNHIACDSETQRNTQGQIVGVLDLDCEAKAGYDKDDQTYLEQISQILGRQCDFDACIQEERH